MTVDLDFIHDHTSGKYDRSPDLLEELLDEMILQHGDLITVTEVGSEPRARKLHERGFHVFRKTGAPGRDECAAVFRASVFDFIAGDSVLISKKRWYSSTGHLMRPVYVLFLVLRHRASGRVLLVCVGHFASGVEGDGGEAGIWSDSIRRVAATIDAAYNLRIEKKKWVDKYSVDAQLFGGDFNMNINRPAVRAWFKTQFPKAVPDWTENPDSKGTLGARFIDTFFLLGLIVVWGPKAFFTKSSDHRWTRKIVRFI